MIDKLNFSKLGGLIPAVVQDAATRQVLMVGFMNREAVERSLADRKAIFWSRTRRRLWQKGESSGNMLDIVSVETDCDGDALLIKAEPRGPVCHKGSDTCFGEHRLGNPQMVFDRLEKIVARRKEQMPERSYTAALFREGMPRIAQKVGEEAVEVVVAAFDRSAETLANESADLLYHLIVLLHERGLSLGTVADALAARMEKGSAESS